MKILNTHAGICCGALSGLMPTQVPHFTPKNILSPNDKNISDAINNNRRYSWKFLRPFTERKML